MTPHFLGIEIGGTKLQLVLGNSQAEIIDRRRLAVDKTQGGEGIRAQIKSAIPDLLKSGKVAGVGVGFGGPVDWKRDKIACSHQIEGWSDFELGKWLTSLTGAPVRVDNDANTAALAEAVRGAGGDANPVFYVTLGSGVGGGLVVDGKIYHGAAPGESEIGHVRLDKSGTIVEARCSGWAVDQRIRAGAQNFPESVLSKLTMAQPGGEARHLAAALEQGDEYAQQVVDEVADDLAFGLSHVTHLMHPEIIVIGGGVSLIGEPLRREVAEALPRYIMHVFHPVPRVSLALLAEDAVPVGALLLAQSAGK